MERSKWYKRFLWAPLCCMAMLTASIPAMAAPVVGPAGMAFYDAPATLPAGTHGDLIRYRTTTKVPPGSPDCNAWQVMYRSTDALGVANAVTGTVIVPKAASSLAKRPIIIYTVGTHGLCQTCAPSIQIEQGTDYENANIAAALKAGYAVVITDNPGYTTGDLPSYMVGTAQAHAALDIAKAAIQIPSVSLVSDAQVGIWGYSQGGQTAAWAGQLEASYMPSLNLVGVAAGGVPGDLIDVGHYIDGKVGSSFLLQVVMGLWSQYPDSIPLEELANAQGKDAIERAQTMCVFESLFEFMYLALSDLVIGNPSLDELIDTYVYDELTAQKLGNIAINAPVYLYHGTADEFIPLEQHLKLKEAYCKMGMDVTFGVYPGEHIITQFQASPYVLAWLKDRFDGVRATNTCSTFLKKRPVSTANPTDGDFIVSMDEWPLAATVHLARLDQDVVLPAGSTFSADTNMTTNNITGSLYVPTFDAKIKIAFIPATVNMTIEPTDPMTGDVSLDYSGILHVHGNAYTAIKINAVGLTSLGIPFSCETEDSVDFPLDFDGPISSLGNGNMKFSGTTTFPPMTGCIFKSLFTALMSGPGQGYKYTVSPPAPTTW